VIISYFIFQEYLSHIANGGFIFCRQITLTVVKRISCIASGSVTAVNLKHGWT